MSDDPDRGDALDDQRQAREHEEEARRRQSGEVADSGGDEGASADYEAGMPTSTDER